LIEEKKGKTGPFRVDMKKVKELRGKFKERVKNTEWCKDTGCTIKVEVFQKSFDEMLELLESITI
jgi:hypothetical protein